MIVLNCIWRESLTGRSKNNRGRRDLFRQTVSCCNSHCTTSVSTAHKAWTRHLGGRKKRQEETQPRALLQDVTEIDPDTRPYRGRRKEMMKVERRAWGIAYRQEPSQPRQDCHEFFSCPRRQVSRLFGDESHRSRWASECTIWMKGRIKWLHRWLEKRPAEQSETEGRERVNE